MSFCVSLWRKEEYIWGHLLDSHLLTGCRTQLWYLQMSSQKLRLLYLRGVDYFPQWPHQGTIYSHQLLRLDLVSLVQHNPEENNRTALMLLALCYNLMFALVIKMSLNQPVLQYLILSSWFFRAFITSENSSEMSNLWASNSKMILSTRSANHSKTAAKS